LLSTTSSQAKALNIKNSRQFLCSWQTVFSRNKNVN